MSGVTASWRNCPHSRRPFSRVRSVAVAIVGDAGAGKSRLAWEFSRSLRPDTWQVIQAEAVSVGRDIPYQLIGAVLRSAFGIDERDEPGKSISRVQSQLAQLEGAAAYLPALLSLLALPLGEDAAAWDSLDPLQRRDALCDSVSAVLSALARRHPILFLIEDLQWADDESRRLFDFLPARDCRLLLVTTHRPEFHASLDTAEPKDAHATAAVVGHHGTANSACISRHHGSHAASGSDRAIGWKPILPRGARAGRAGRGDAAGRHCKTTNNRKYLRPFRRSLLLASTDWPPRTNGFWSLLRRSVADFHSDTARDI